MPQNVPPYAARTKTVLSLGLTGDVNSDSAQIAALSTWANSFNVPEGVLATLLAGLTLPDSDFGLEVKPYHNVLEAFGILARSMVNTAGRTIRYDQEKRITLATSQDAFLGVYDQSFTSGSAWVMAGGTFRTVTPTTQLVPTHGFHFAMRVEPGQPEIILKPGSYLNGFGRADAGTVRIQGGESYEFTAVIIDPEDHTVNYWQVRATSTTFQHKTGTVVRFTEDAEYDPIFSGTFTLDPSAKRVGVVVSAYLGPAATAPSIPSGFQLLSGAYASGVNLMYMFKVGANGSIQYTITQLP